MKFKKEKIISRNKKIFAYEILTLDSNSVEWDKADTDTLNSIVIKQILYACDSYEKINIDTVNNYFINIERRQLYNLGFMKKLKLLVDEMKVNNINIVFEITERGQVRTDDVFFLKILKNEYGFSFAADDVSQVDNRKNEFSENIYDFIKLDKLELWFADDNQTKNWMYNIIETTKTRFIAEKIENENELSLARSLPFCFFQGYFFKCNTSCKKQKLRYWLKKTLTV